MTATPGSATETAPIGLTARPALGSGAPARPYWAALAAQIGLVLLALLLFAPSLVRSGFLFERDASFFVSARADTSWSIGTFSLLGGTSTIGTQGLFYAPYGVIAAVFSALGLTAAEIGKLIPLLLGVLASLGSFRLLRDVGASVFGCTVGSVLFLLNPWSLDQFGFFYIWTGYCVLPLVILGAVKIGRHQPAPWWYPITFLLLGGVISWLMAFVSVGITLVSMSGRRPGTVRVLVQGYKWWLLAGLYWIPAYAFWVVHGDTAGLGYSSTGGVLETARPLTDLLELRDFWWPHLSPGSAAGSTLTSLGTLAILILVGVAIAHTIHGLSPRRTDLDRTLRPLPKGLIFGLLLLGLVLGEGTSGIFGGLYTGVRQHVPVGRSFVASVMRSPADLAAPFVIAVCLALGRGLLSYPRHELGIVALRQITRSRWPIAATLAALVAVGCAPGVLAFWKAYEPVDVPHAYSDLSAAVPPGTALELGDWNVAAIDPRSGVWHFTWSRRMAADPTTITASLRHPVLAATSTGVAALGVRILNSSNPRAAARDALSLTRQLGVSSLLVEDDLALPDSLQQDVSQFLQALAADGITAERIGENFVLPLPSPARPPIWSATCGIDTAWLWLGAVHLNCPNGAVAQSLQSPFPLPTNNLTIGISLGNPEPISDGLGTRVHIVHGDKGWIIDPVQLIAVLGGTASGLTVIGFLAVRAGRRIRKFTAARAMNP